MRRWATRTMATALVAVGVAAARADEKTESTPPPETELGKLAASLKPGEMKELKTKGHNWEVWKSFYDWEKDIRGAHMGYSAVSWANQAHWDSVGLQVLYFGLGHYASPKFLSYSAVSNEWTVMPLPEWADKRKRADKNWPVGHTYDDLAIWPEKRLYAVAAWDPIQVYNIQSNTWKAFPGYTGISCKGAIEAFPSLGGFLLCSWQESLMVLNPETGKARGLTGKVHFGMHGVMEHNPVHDVMVVGAGDGGFPSKYQGVNNRLYLVDNKGAVKQLKPIPMHLRCTPECNLTCDPVSGEYIAKSADGKVWAFHPIKDEWKRLEGVRVPGPLSVAIDTYGVILYCGGTGKFDGSKETPMYVYKHKPAFPSEEPKDVKTGEPTAGTR